jgi:hypothetical protein
MITVLLSPGKHKDKFETVLKEHKRHVSNANDGKYDKAIDTDEVYWYATGKMCDCGTELGSCSEYEEYRLPLSEIKKLEKKGWTKSKINRYLNEIEKNNIKEKRINSLRNDSTFAGKENPDGWLDILKDLFEIDKGVKVGIVKHWYTRPLSPDVLKKSNRIKIKFDDDLGKKLFQIEEDKCYIISV